MGVTLDNKDLIAGYRPAVFKNALRRYARTHSPENLIDLKGAFPLRRDGAIVFEECLDRGLIDPQTLQLTSAGEILTRAKARKRTPLEKAETVLQAFLDRAEAMNADADAISQVDEVWLFGSVMRGEPSVGDIDLAVCTSRKDRFKTSHDARERHADDLVRRTKGAPEFWQFPWEKEGWLGRRSLYGARRHPLLAGAQQGTNDLASLGVPCRLIFDRKRDGRVDDPILDRHPESKGRDSNMEPPAEIPDLAPAAIRPMDGRWVAGYSSWGMVSPYDIFRGWTDDAHRIFPDYPQHLRVFADDHELRSFPWAPRRLKRPGLDGRSSLLLVDATERSGLSIVLNRRIETSHGEWVLHASFSDIELHRSRKRIGLASTPSIVGAVSLILAVDAERMLRRAAELAPRPIIVVNVAQDGLLDDEQSGNITPIVENLQSRSILIEPADWRGNVEVTAFKGAAPSLCQA